MESKMKAVMNVAVFLIALLLITSMRGKTSASVDLNQENIVLSGPDGYHRSIAYTQVVADSVKLLGEEDLDKPGSVVTGGENRKYRWGQWENDAWGKYTLCIQQKIDAALCFETVDGETVIFNVESEDTTKAFEDAFRELVVYCQSGETAA